MSDQFRREEYASRINKALNYIEKNIDQSISLEDVSKAASFSPFHFHRIFKAYLGETPNEFICRIRLEKAGVMLVVNPKNTITEIAQEVGFSSSQVFARAFKRHYDMTPTEYREEKWKNSKISNTDSKQGEAYRMEVRYIDNDDRPSIQYKMLNTEKMKVEIKELPDMHVAYVRHIGPYAGDAELFKGLFEKLGSWAGPRNLFKKDTRFLSIYYDDPKSTDPEKQRTDVCLTVPEDTEVEGEISKQVIEGGTYAVASFEVDDPSGYADAWEAVYSEWLPNSGYQPENKPAFELYQNDASKDPEGKHKFDICLPVKPL